MNTVLLESQIFGPVFLYSLFTAADEIIIEQHENYQKRSFRNRYTLLTANGPVTMSIPLQKGKNQQMPVRDVRVAYDSHWISKHLQCIRSAYGRSPYFDHYFDKIAELLNKRHIFLFDLNMETFLWVLKQLHLDINVRITDRYQKEYDDLSDFRSFNPDDISCPVKYTQVWEEKFNFTPNLSVLDLLFCTGPEAPGILVKMKIWETIKDKTDFNASF